MAPLDNSKGKKNPNKTNLYDREHLFRFYLNCSKKISANIIYPPFSQLSAKIE